MSFEERIEKKIDQLTKAVGGSSSSPAERLAMVTRSLPKPSKTADEIAGHGIFITNKGDDYFLIIPSTQLRYFGDRFKVFLESFRKDQPIIPVAPESDEKGD